ncbi:response regulator [Devriesea agamarum]|uniref:response regulator n=1 Tax=Devriesea agamarum TaxID=472569 RepID=UPI00071DB517|nr:response regulator transcription factor [Devriesea agamarum]
MPIRVGIVDDQSLLVSAFAALVETASDMTVVATALSGAEALEIVSTTDIDVLLMDVKMPDMSGLDITRVIAARADRPRILMLTTFNINEYVTEALRSGARGFIFKDANSEEFLDAIRSVHAGRMVLANEAAHHVAEALRVRPDGVGAEDATSKPQTHSGAERGVSVDTALRDLRVRLTPREQQVLVLVGKGRTNPEIARELFIAETTVKSHVSSLLSKLGCRDRVGLAVLVNRR